MGKTLVYDLGTTYFKVCLFEETGKLAALQRIATPVRHPSLGRWEIPAPVFFQCLTNATVQLSHQLGGLQGVDAVTFATQANSFVLLDGEDAAITPLILWPDDRATAIELLLPRPTKLDNYCFYTGVPTPNRFMLPYKLAWFQQHHPRTIEQTRRVALISDFLTLWFTGQHLGEAGTAGLSGLLNIHELQWWKSVCENFQVLPEWLPTIVRAGADAGPLRAEVARHLGLPLNCRFVVGCLDQYAGAIGAGNLLPGNISETTGTVLATVRCTDEYQPTVLDEVYRGPSWTPRLYYEMTFSDISARLLEAFRNSLENPLSFQELDQLAAGIPPGADGVRILTGPAANGGDKTFHGLERHHTTGHKVRAILEAVAHELDRQLEVLCGSDRPVLVRSVGGAARSKLWLEIKSQILSCRVEGLGCPEPTSLGAALLAQRARLGGELVDLACQWGIIDD